MRRIVSAVAFMLISFGLLFGQTTVPASLEASVKSPRAIALTLPAGTPLPVVLDKEMRIHKAGQPIHGRIAEPVYAFDQLVVPAGSEVTGSVSRLGGLTAQKRALAALNANFSPSRDVQIDFDQLILPDGRHVPLHTKVSPASQGVLQFVASTDAKTHKGEKKRNAADKLAAEKIGRTRQEINREWETAKKQISAPGKVHRLERFGIAQLPYHPQYMDAGTRFNAELLQPLDFGTEELTPERVHMVGTAPAPGSIIHALLETPLSSARSKTGDLVEAVMTEPLFAKNQLVLPQGTHLQGSVLQAQPARSMRRNGQLRIVFHEIVPPKSAKQHVEASLEGVEVKNDEQLSLDSEGGAQATTPKTRYLTTGISIALAASSFGPDSDAGRSMQQSGGEAGARAANGASGFRVVGIFFGVLVHSRALASGFGIYGAGMSIYEHFLTRGRDVEYPKDTAMAIGFGSRVTGATKASPGT
jgi:hypothetical protein